MKTLLLALPLCFTLSVVALSQDALNQAPRKTQAARVGARLITIMGTIQEDGDTLRFVTDQRAWNVDNPETLRPLRVTKDTTCTRRLMSTRTRIQFTSQK
jgi:hypothetical protein